MQPDEDDEARAFVDDIIKRATEWATDQATLEAMRRGHRVSESDTPGLWNVSGYPELTTAQFLGIFNPYKPRH